MKTLTILLMIATAHGRPQYDFNAQNIQPTFTQYHSDDSQKNTFYNPLNGGNVYSSSGSSGGQISTSMYTGANNQGLGINYASGGGSSATSFVIPTISQGLGINYASGGESSATPFTGPANNQGFGIDYRSGGGSSTAFFAGQTNNQGLGANVASGGIISTNRFQGGNPANNLAISTSGETVSTTKYSGGIKYAQPIVEKHVYVHVAPEDQDESKVINITPPPPKIHYKIIFIKAPSAKVKANIIQQQHQEEKTIVYVLVKKPEISVKSEVIETPKSKPEVYFIKYQTKGDKAQDDGSLLLSTNLAQGKPSIVATGGSSSSASKFDNVSNLQQLGLSATSGGSSTTTGLNLNASGSGTSNVLGFDEYGPPKSG